MQHDETIVHRRVRPAASMPDDESQTGTGPLDAEVLGRIARRVDASGRFATVEHSSGSAPTAIVADYDTRYFPAVVDRAFLRIRWYETDDFSIHYSEQYRDRPQWECRWDRHPNNHNTRAHFRPPPDAATPGEDASYPTDWRDVLTRVLNALDDRLQSFWE